MQLSAWGKNTDPPQAGEGVATVRWGQSANVGYVPNKKMPRTFMATAIDLGAYQVPACLQWPPALDPQQPAAVVSVPSL